jgi:hypothetical protein
MAIRSMHHESVYFQEAAMDQVSKQASQNQARGPFQARTGLRAGYYGRCEAYCDQEFSRCANTPGMPIATCDDRYPVCQNACAVCSGY